MNLKGSEEALPVVKRAQFVPAIIVYLLVTVGTTGVPGVPDRYDRFEGASTVTDSVGDESGPAIDEETARSIVNLPERVEPVRQERFEGRFVAGAGALGFRRGVTDAGLGRDAGVVFETGLPAAYGLAFIEMAWRAPYPYQPSFHMEVFNADGVRVAADDGGSPLRAKVVPESAAPDSSLRIVVTLGEASPNVVADQPFRPVVSTFEEERIPAGWTALGTFR